MSFTPTATKRTRTKADQAPAPIILATDIHDGRTYAERHGHTRAVIITPRSIARVRGRVGPVYATRRARHHHAYPLMRDEAAPAGATLPRTPRDRRIA